MSFFWHLLGRIEDIKNLSCYRTGSIAEFTLINSLKCYLQITGGERCGEKINKNTRYQHFPLSEVTMVSGQSPSGWFCGEEVGRSTEIINICMNERFFLVFLLCAIENQLMTVRYGNLHFILLGSTWKPFENKILHG